MRYRKSIDHLKAALKRAEDEPQVCRLVAQINELVRKVNTLGTNAINLGVSPVDEGEELRKFRERWIA